MKNTGRKKNHIKLVVFLLLLVALSVYIFWPGTDGNDMPPLVPPPAAEPQFLHEGNLVFFDDNRDTLAFIAVEVVADDDRRMRGLMYRSKMENNQGMLFIFDEEEPQSFWMRNTKISLDIIYVNTQKEVVSIVKGTKPYSDTPVPSQKPAMYVVEVNAGFTDRKGISEGTKVEFELF